MAGSRLFGTISLLATSASTLAISAALTAASATSAAAASPAPVEIESVTVTASRLTQRGFNAPTPTTVMTASDIANAAQPNVFDLISQLPSLQGSVGVTSATGMTSGGSNSLSSFNMRGLGTYRVLTLFDGQRYVPAYYTGVTDISMFPQLLISRVDVVTGGASASYGSDAVSGVINVVTDKTFDGVKYNIEGGISTYGDGANGLIQVAAGTPFLGGRGHIEISVEDFHQDEIGPGHFGTGPGPGGRNFPAPILAGYSSPAATPAGSPQYIVENNVQDMQYSIYGMITNTALAGTAFGGGGQPYQFQYGTNCINNTFCIGGDRTAAANNVVTLSNMLDRKVFYNRTSFELSPHAELYETVTLGEVKSTDSPNPAPRYNSNLTITNCQTNPFIPASVQQACVADGITSFKFGTYNGNFPTVMNVVPDRREIRVVAGVEGDFNLFSNWTYDAYFEHGQTNNTTRVTNMVLQGRYKAAINPILLNGSIVCPTAAERASGCVPLDVFGNIAPTPAALAYVAPANGPYQEVNLIENAGSVTFNGAPIDDWAGPVAVALGAEYRSESYHTSADPYGNGFTASDPANAAYPSDPTLTGGGANLFGSNWQSGNFYEGAGRYEIVEGFAEAGVPLVNSADIGKADLDLAGRVASYSTFGQVNTWKIGVTYDTPLSGVRLRALRSRDVRAPNLSELYGAPQAFTTQINPYPTGTPQTILTYNTGNPSLKPEESITTEFGFVYDGDKSFMPGLNFSVDYYNINIGHAISAPFSAQQLVTLCGQGVTSLCSAIVGTAAAPTAVYVEPFNVADIKTSGLDVEATYHFGMDDWNIPGEWKIPGDFVFHALLNHTFSLKTYSGVPGTNPIESAGALQGLGNTLSSSSAPYGTTPYWKGRFSEEWTGGEGGKWYLSFTERWFSAGVLDHKYIQCSTNCPVSTALHPTINDNHLPGALYVDINASYKVNDWASLYVSVTNLANVPPAAVASPQPNADGTNPLLYDIVGRMFHIGVRGTF